MDDHWMPVWQDGELVALVRMGKTPATSLTAKRMDAICKGWPTSFVGVSSQLSASTLERFAWRPAEEGDRG